MPHYYDATVGVRAGLPAATAPLTRRNRRANANLAARRYGPQRSHCSGDLPPDGVDPAAVFPNPVRLASNEAAMRHHVLKCCRCSKFVISLFAVFNFGMHNSTVYMFA